LKERVREGEERPEAGRWVEEEEGEGAAEWRV
jgi:predicted transcriptional regulator